MTLPTALSSATHDAANRLTAWGATSLGYDLNGDLVSEGSRTYEWNARGELVRIADGSTEIATFEYDGLGRRTSKAIGATTTGFAYDGGTAVQELSGSTPTANLLTGGTDQVFRRSDASGARFPLTDVLGSTVGLTDASGVIQTSYAYEPFGATTVSGAANGNPTQFTGRENDGTGLYYYRARYYHPTYGRFISEDPIGFWAGDPNLYAYVGNSPTNATDASGHFLDVFIDAAFIASDLWAIATGTRKERETAWGSLALDIGGLFLPFVFGVGHIDDVARVGDDLLDFGKRADGVKPPRPPRDPATAPGPGWEWRGKGEPGGREGNWYHPETDQSLHPDLGHPPPIGPHWDWKDPEGNWWRIFEDGSIRPK